MNYLKIDKEDVCNGEGLRVVLWLSGCSHKCYLCQNPQTWDANSGIPFDESAKEELLRELDKDYISGLTLSGGDPLFESNLDDVLNLVTEVNKRYNTTQDIAYDRDKNNNILNANANEFRLSYPKKSIWLYTGFTWNEIMEYKYPNDVIDLEDAETRAACDMCLREEIISQCDVLVDGRYIDSQRDITLKWRGSKNQNVINVKESLRQGKVVLWC